MRFLILTLTFFFTTTAYADTITLSVRSLTITLPSAFTPGFQGSTGDGKWDYFSTPDGAAVRVMRPMGNAITADTAGNFGWLWLASLTETPFAGEIKAAIALDVCKAGLCSPAVFSASFTHGSGGLLATTGAATTVRIGDSFVYLTPGVNTLRAWNSTIDGFLTMQTTAVPEPATLLLLGAGLAGIARKLKKRREK